MTLLARIFAVDATRCYSYGSRLRLITALTEPASVQRYLKGAGRGHAKTAGKGGRPGPFFSRFWRKWQARTGFGVARVQWHRLSPNMEVDFGWAFTYR